MKLSPPQHDHERRHMTSRRTFAAQVSGGVAAAVLGSACGKAQGAAKDGGVSSDTDTDLGRDVGSADSGFDAGTFDAGIRADASEPGCTLYMEQTEGPFYLDGDLLRRDIKEGKPGAPLTLRIQVVSASSCEPVAGVAVDVWHCDAVGVYSGYPRQLGGIDTTGETFLRGTQLTDDAGVAEFETIYPGWYPGRTTHIHFKVRTDVAESMTSQLYFPEDVTESVYRTGVYEARGQKDTANLADGIARTGGSLPPLLSLRMEGDVFVGTLRVALA